MVNLLFNSISQNTLLPSESEISQATRIIRYNEIENPINDRCPISHEPFQENDSVTQVVFCRHIFDSNEINTWFQRNSHCPVCRHSILNNLNTSNFNVNAENENSESGTANGGNAISSNVNSNISEVVNDLISNYGYDVSGNYLLFETFYRRN